MTQESQERVQVVLWLVCSALVLFPTLGMGSIFSSDDALYAQMAREMVSSGSWLEPTWLGAPIFDKPPLLFWMLGSFGALFGFNEFVLRLPGALSAMVAIYYGLRLMKMTAESENARRESLRGWVSIALILASVTFVMNVRRPMADPLLVAAMLAHLTYGLRAVDQEPGLALRRERGEVGAHRLVVDVGRSAHLDHQHGAGREVEHGEVLRHRQAAPGLRHRCVSGCLKRAALQLRCSGPGIGFQYVP